MSDKLAADIDHIAPADVRRVLDELCQSGGLQRIRLQKLLRYLVEEKLQGREGYIKAYTIAQDVFDRRENFDPQTDSIVRVEMGRLRKAIDLYNAENTTDVEMRIFIPVGTYVPVFERITHDAAKEGSEDAREDGEDLTGSTIDAGARWFGRSRKLNLGAAAFLALLFVVPLLWVAFISPSTNWFASAKSASINSVAILPIKSTSTARQQAEFNRYLTQGLINILQSGNLLSVVTLSEIEKDGSTDFVKIARELNVRFLLKGEVYRQDQQVQTDLKNVLLSLIDGKNGVIVWTEQYQLPADFRPSEYEVFLRNIGFDLNPAYYAAAKKIIDQENSKSQSAVELFMLSTWVPGTAVSSLEWELERVELAKKALAVDPDFGPAHAVLADKLAYLATVNPPSDTQEQLDQSRYHASMALAFANQTADALYNIVSHKLHLGEIQEASRLARRTVLLDPKNVLADFYTESMVFTCRIATDDELKEFVDFHNELNPKNPARWITANTISRIELNRKNYAEAVKWGRISEGIFQSLGAAFQLSAVLVQNGDIEAARRIIDRHKLNWPNLNARHFADVVIPRRCGQFETIDHLKRVYGELADALEQ